MRNKCRHAKRLKRRSGHTPGVLFVAARIDCTWDPNPEMRGGLVELSEECRPRVIKPVREQDIPCHLLLQTQYRERRIATSARPETSFHRHPGLRRADENHDVRQMPPGTLRTFDFRCQGVVDDGP